jgi:mannose-6-phosphate isomerase-like protein (cupin superfamily)
MSVRSAITAMPIVFFVLSLAAQTPKPHAKVVTLRKTTSGIQPILTGPPETVSMKSGYVVLEPGRTVGRHSTEHHEEILIVLQGEGEMVFHDGSTMTVNANSALYCPPETEHDVRNTGSENLRYVYVTAQAQ